MKPRPISTLIMIPTRPPRHALVLQGARSTFRSQHNSATSTCLNYTHFRDRQPVQIANRIIQSRTSQPVRYASSSSPRTAKKPSSKPTKSLVKPSKSTNQSSAGPPIVTATTKATKAAKSTTTVPAKREWVDRLNPPPTTYAPELAVPGRKEGQGTLGYLWAAGKAYIAFYKKGISNVRATAKVAKTLRQKKVEGGERRTGVVAQQLEKESASSPAQSNAVIDAVLTRAEWQIVRRSRTDILRLPAFAALVLLFGEWLPLFAVWLTPLVPEPCRIPKQVTRDIETKEKRREMRLKGIQLNAFRIAHSRRGTSASVVSDREMHNPASIHPTAVKGMDYLALLMAGARFNCYGRFWANGLLPPDLLLRWRVERYLQYLVHDDGLIERDGGWQRLATLELRRACIERGFNVLGKSDAALKAALKEWFEEARKRRAVE